VANATLSRLDFLDTFSSMEKVSERKRDAALAAKNKD
jgi:hypothetical protein